MDIYGQGERSVEDRALVQVRFSDYRRAWVFPRSSEVAADGRRVLTDDEKSCMLLVMRTLSIVPLNFKVCVLCGPCNVRLELEMI